MQVRIRKTTLNLHTQDVRPEEMVTYDPVKYFKSLNPMKLKILSRLFSFYTDKKRIWISQGRLAKELGISRQWCNVLMRELEEDGLFISNYRHMKSNEYKMSSFFRSSKVRRLLAPLFRPFRALFLSLLTRVNTQGYMKEDIILKRLKKGTSRGRNLSMYQLLHQNKLLDAIKNRKPYENPISKSIRSISGLPLTKWGQIKLSAFSDPVIEEVKYQYQNTRNIRDPFNWFFYACLRHCKLYSISPDWGWCRSLQAAFKMQGNEPMLIKKQARPEGRKTCKLLPPYIPSHLFKESSPILTTEEKESKIRAEKVRIQESSSNEACSKLQSLLGADIFDRFREKVTSNLVAGNLAC